MLAAIIAALVAGLTTVVSAQLIQRRPFDGGPVPPVPKNFVNYGGEDYERYIRVSPNVNLSLCVVEGKLSVNGWRRDEVRIFVRNGNKFSFKVFEKSAPDEKPVWISAYSHITKAGKPGIYECIRGDAVEVDLPLGATLNLKGESIDTVIDTVRKVNVKTAGGDIMVRNVAGGVNASTFEGDITVEQSKGAFALESAYGNVVVFEAGPSEIGDIFKAKTNSGAISLQRLLHRQIDVSSISGAIAFNGDILGGGSYNFGTNNGSITLNLPQKSAFQLLATYTFGKFASELPLSIITENDTPGPVRSIVAKVGVGGDATLKVTADAGLIGLKKQ